jgi:hypothetical protein
MSRLIDALKKKYKTPAAALEALGLDVALLKSAVVGDAMPGKFSRKRLARDAEPNAQFRREQFNEGPAEDAEEGTTQVEDYTALAPELAKYLREYGLDDESINEACRMAHEAREDAMDEPPPFRGRPRPGGTMDPIEEDEDLGPQSKRAVPGRFEPDRHGATDSMISKQNGVINSRNVALAFASRIERDSSIPVQHFGSPTPQSKRARRQLGSDAARSHSSHTMADTYSRFPMLARIGRA